MADIQQPSTSASTNVAHRLWNAIHYFIPPWVVSKNRHNSKTRDKFRNFINSHV